VRRICFICAPDARNYNLSVILSELGWCCLLFEMLQSGQLQIIGADCGRRGAARKATSFADAAGQGLTDFF
jgi:hypothetical protein